MESGDDAYFSTVPWCRALLSDPSFERVSGIHRNSTSPTYDTLISKTLNSDSTIRAIVCMKEKHNADKETLETITLIYVGSDMNGHVDVMHGGAVATILDEVAGFVVRQWSEQAGNSDATFVTAQLNVRYVKPLRTPGAIAVKGSTPVADERKKSVMVQIYDGEQLVAAGEALFVKPRNPFA